MYEAPHNTIYRIILFINYLKIKTPQQQNSTYTLDMNR